MLYKLAAKDRIQCLSRPREGQGNSRKAKLAGVGSGMFSEGQQEKTGKTLRARRFLKLLEFGQNVREIIPLFHRHHLIHTCILNHTKVEHDRPG